jgi:hypothetical protein
LRICCILVLLCILSVVIFSTNYQSLGCRVKVVILTQASGMASVH